MSRRVTDVIFGTVVPALSLSGCAGRARISTQAMCEVHGGSYSSQAKQCTYPPQQPPRSAELCRMHGGELDPVTDECAINDRTK